MQNTLQFHELQIDRHEKIFVKLSRRDAFVETVASEHRCNGKVLYHFNNWAEVGVLPANSNDRLHELVLNLQAANGKTIAINNKRYG